MSERDQTLLELEGVVTLFGGEKPFLRARRPLVHAVDGVSLELRRGEIFGLVGESGCGKSTTGRAILQLYKPTAGEVNFHPKDQQRKDLTKLDGGEMRRCDESARRSPDRERLRFDRGRR